MRSRRALLVLRICDLHPRLPLVTIPRRADSKADKRREEPNTKTFDREIELAPSVMKALRDYINVDRRAIRAARMNIKESYVIIRHGELFLIGMHISPLSTASTHNKHDPVRTRKLLLHAREISKLIGKVERAGYALVPIDLHFVRGRIKLEIGLAKGKKQHDKRADQMEKEGKREAQRAMKDKLR